MLTKLLRLAILIFPLFASSQAGMWKWVKGSNISNPSPVFGTRGVESASNEPPAVYEGINWTDTAGNFWVFGGTDQSFDTYADLWKYNPLTNNWTWIKGPGTTAYAGVYGSLGVPSTANNPPSLGWGAASWVDLNGDFWMFAGLAEEGESNALWRYNIASNTWTWMSGSSMAGAVSVYGTEGVPSATNVPGSQQEGTATWVDAENNLWLFGGLSPGNDVNTVWRYSVSNNEWAWMKGSDVGGAPASYGTIGVENVANDPGARWAYCSWKDLNGNFWLFGGGQESSPNNDMWKFNPSTNNWTWMSGTSNADDAGIYGTTCTRGTNYYPAARNENKARWTDACGKFWLYGGANNNFETFEGDLWQFDPTNLQWDLVKGSSAADPAPVFGSIGVASATNTPGGRIGNITWMDKVGNLYLFGGRVNSLYSNYNDLWVFTPDPTCTGDSSVPPLVNLGPDTTFCGAFSQTLNSGYSNTVWSTGANGSQITVNAGGTYWAKVNTGCGSATDTITIADFTVTPVAVTADTGAICAYDTATICATPGLGSYLWNTGDTGACISTNLAGNYYVTVTEQNNCTVLSNRVQLTVFPAPPVTITLIGDTLVAYNSPGYQWYLNNQVLPGDTNGKLVTTKTGSYTVVVTDSNGCQSTSNAFVINDISTSQEAVISVFPNPQISTGWTLVVPPQLVGNTAEIYDDEGKVVFEWLVTNIRSQINPDLAQGVYLLKMNLSGTSFVRKLFKL